MIAETVDPRDLEENPVSENPGSPKGEKRGPETNHDDESLSKAPKQGPEDPAGLEGPMAKPDEQVYADDRDYLQSHVLFSKPLLHGGVIERVDSNSGDYLRFFMANLPNTCRNYAYVPMWRVQEDAHHLDELALLINAQGKKVVSFNLKPPHGTWVFDEPCTAGQFLDIKLNVRYGEPGNEDLPSDGKWTRFQRATT